MALQELAEILFLQCLDRQHVRQSPEQDILLWLVDVELIPAERGKVRVIALRLPTISIIFLDNFWQTARCAGQLPANCLMCWTTSGKLLDVLDNFSQVVFLGNVRGEGTAAATDEIERPNLGKVKNVKGDELRVLV